MDQPVFFTTGQVAAMLGIHPQTLRRWERAGIIPPVARRLGRRQYSVPDIERIRSAVVVSPRESPKVSRS